MNRKLKKWIKSFLVIDNKLITSRLQVKYLIKYHLSRYNEIINFTKFLDFNSTMSEKIYCIINDIKDKTKCENCRNNNCKYINFGEGYRTYCSVKCMRNSKKIQEKIEKTNLEKYGIEHAAQSQEIKDKTKQVFLEKYGVENPSQLKEIREKTKKTNMERYGVENVFQFKETRDKIRRTWLKKYGVECISKSLKIQEKIKKTNLEKYGVENISQSNIVKEKKKQIYLERYGVESPFQSEEVKNKIKKTCQKKYGVNNPSQSQEIKDKKIQTCLKNYGVEYALRSHEIKDNKKQTCLERYGVEYPSQLQKIKEKQIQTCLDKYGVENPNQSHISKESLKKLNSKKWLKNEYHNNKKTLFEIAVQLNVCYKTIHNYFTKHNIEVKRFQNSFPEKEISQYINMQDMQTNTRKIISPLELDVYIPDYKLAIEFDGLYWHSKNPKNYHLDKTQMCAQKGIQLLHIFENEWIDPVRQDIWKSIINNKLGKNDKIYARKTEVREISNNELVREFLDNNHLQGFVGSSVKLGLFYKNELVGIMTFGKTRFSKKYEYEMIRFCNKKFISVVGGASKLYKYFIRNYKPKSVVSYADRRYSDGNLYRQLGMTFSHCSAPNYWYFKLPDMTLHSRVQFQKHKLGYLLENFDSELTEVENMTNNGYLRIFDCGNVVHKYELLGNS